MKARLQAVGVESERADAAHGGGGRARADLVAPEQRRDAGEQGSGGEGLGDVVVGAELQAERLVDLAVTRGEQDDRQLAATLAQLAAEAEAVERGMFTSLTISATGSVIASLRPNAPSGAVSTS